MTNKKQKLQSLSIRSFVTSMDKRLVDTIKGGATTIDDPDDPTWNRSCEEHRYSIYNCSRVQNCLVG